MDTSPVRDKVVEKYLLRYAEPEARELPGMNRHYDYCLVIPAFNESWTTLSRVWKDLRADFLVILVLNSPPDEAGGPEPDRNLLELLSSGTRQSGTRQSGTRQGRSTHIPGSPDMLLVDRSTPGHTIDKRQGVGLASKIGSDIALALIHAGIIRHPVIFGTDADARLPARYFDTPVPDRCAAVVFPYTHLPEPGLEIPTLLYEISLLYYAGGLRHAGSPYGFTTLGSATAIHAQHYARVRGFPRRAAGEDFYMLNKLAKTGTIHAAGGEPIVLSGRLSDRVPFGTGPGIRKILALDDPVSDYPFYHPVIFDLLRECIGSLDTGMEAALPVSSPPLQHYLQVSGLAERMDAERARHRKESTYHKSLRDWFDGFRTLKFVHFMRDHYYPSVPLADIHEARFMKVDNEPDPLLRLVRAREHLLQQLFPARLPPPETT